MPMFTPTTTRVMASDSTPPMFRPGNQANLEPAMPANVSPMQDMLPGMGDIRSGNPMVTGLAPKEEGEFARQVAADQGKSRSKGSWLGRSSDFASGFASAQAELEQAQTRGDSVGIRNAQRRIKAITARRNAVAAQKHMQRTNGAGTSLPWWKRRTTIYDTKANSYQPRAQVGVPMPERYGPRTPNPLDYEPVGISHQKGMRQIMAMQANYQPVTTYKALEAKDRMKSLEGLGNWFTDRMIPGIPNWALAAGGGAALILFMKRK